MGDERVHVRPATDADEGLLLEWRNRPEIVDLGARKSTVTADEHHTWYAASMANPDRELYVIEVDASPSGMLRFDIEDDSAEISIFLLNGFPGRGLGTQAVRQVLPGFVNRHACPTIEARVLLENERSKHFFMSLGFNHRGQLPANDTVASCELYTLDVDVVPHSRPYVGEVEANAAANVVRSLHLAQGRRVAALETEWRNAVSTGDAVAVSSGLSALRLALLGLGIGPGDEVIVPAYSCVALLNAVMAFGSVPVLADVNPGSWTICAEDVARRQTERTRAAIVVHMFGAPGPVAEVEALGIPVIEDCAHGIGGQTADGKPFGGAGTLSISSFYATKMLCGGEGGIIAGNDLEVMSRLRNARDYGDQLPSGQHFNDKMTDVEASVVLAQLARLPEILERRERAACQYRELLAELAVVGRMALPEQIPGRIWYRYTVSLAEPQAEAVVAQARKMGVHLEQPVWDLRACEQWHDALPETAQAFERVLSLPLYPDIKPFEMDRVAAALNDLVKK